MNLKRVGVLLGKEYFHGSRSYMFIMAIVMPLAMSFLVNLLLGTFFSGQPTLGITGNVTSSLAADLQETAAVHTEVYHDTEALRRAVESGAADMGIVLPADIDTRVTEGSPVEIEAYTWGESLAKDRMTITTAITDAARTTAGQSAPVTVQPITLGDEASLPWSDRLLPFIVMMAVFLGGAMIPSTSIITEKNKKTINAVLVTPASLADVLSAKGISGLVIALLMGILILVINQAFGSQPALLTLLVALGAVMAVELGLLLGVLLKDIATLFSVWKTAGVLLFAPIIIYLFPGIPSWIGRIFPTYYFLQPVVDISLYGGGWSDIAVNLFILIGITLVLGVIVAATTRKTLQFSS